MTRIEIYCAGRQLRTDDGGTEFSHEAELVACFIGDVGNWALTDPKLRDVARVRGEQYQMRRDAGKHGEAEAARRFGTPSPDQRRLLGQPVERINVNLECQSCPEKLTWHGEKVYAGLDRLVSAAGHGWKSRIAVTAEPGSIPVTLPELRTACRLTNG